MSIRTRLFLTLLLIIPSAAFGDAARETGSGADTATPVPIDADDPTTVSPQAETATPVSTEEVAPKAPELEQEIPSPAGVANEVIVVEGSLPYIPTANMIATRLPIALRWMPANLGTVNEPLLHEQSASVLGDALKNISGTNNHTQSGIADYFTVRGYDSLSGALVTTDGAPEPEVSFYQLYNVERVEVFKGPGAFLHGRNGLSGALAGIVNIVRRQPEPASFSSFGGSFGSYGTYEGKLDVNVAPENSDSFSFRLNALYRESDFYRDDKQNESLAINPALAWKIGSDTTLNVNFEFVDLQFQPDSGLPLFNNEVPEVDRKESYQSPFDFSDQQVGRFQIDLESKVSDSWTVRNKTYYRDLDWQSDGTLLTGFADISNPICQPTTAEPEVCRALTRLDDRQKFMGNQFDAVWAGNTGRVSHNLMIGLEVARYGDQFTLDAETLPSLTLFDSVESPFLGPIPLQSQAGDSRSLVAAPYVINRFTFNQRFQVLAGARYDIIEFEDDLDPNAARSDRDLSPMLGATFAASDMINIYANAAQAFAPPSGRLLGDERPEESTQYELGVKLGRDGGRSQTTVALYQIDRENIGVTGDSGFLQQLADQRSRGVEIEFAAEPRPRLRTFFSYAYNDTELQRFEEVVVVPGGPTFVFDHSGNSAAFAPEHLVNFWMSQRFVNGWGLGFGGRYVSEQFIDEDNQFTIDDYVLLDAAVYYALDNWELSLNFKNITDEDYETRGFSSTSVIPATPFAVYGAFEYRF